MTSIRQQIFENNTTLFGILDAEGVPENNERFSELESQYNELVKQQDDTFKQLTKLSVTVDKNRKDFNEFQVVTLTHMEEIDSNIDKVNINMSKLDQKVGELNKSVIDMNTKLVSYDKRIQNVELNLDKQSNEIVSLSKQVLQNNPYLSGLSNARVVTSTFSAIDIQWRVPQSSLRSNKEYSILWKMLNTNWFEGTISIVEQWDTFNDNASYHYKILKGSCRTRIKSSGSSEIRNGTIDNIA
jgi:ABC-type transporter Mla subunit MlaD